MDGGEIGIAIGSYDREHELVIDPVLQWLSYMGGSYMESGGIIRSAPDGGAYLVFSSRSEYIAFPSTESSPHVFNSGDYRPSVGIVAKLSKDGNLIEQVAYLGGTDGDTSINDVALDSAGNLYLGEARPPRSSR